MFTPPPSPRKNNNSSSTIELTRCSLPDDPKRLVGRRTRWMVLLVPFIVVFITASTQYMVHPVAFDIFSEAPGNSSWDSLAARSRDWAPHKRHPSPQLKSSSTASAPTTPTASVNAPVPTIPSSDPGLPTPFPQPFDDLTQNYSSTSCFNFFTNMTNTTPFRSCRPLSLLIQSSDSFTNAQQNLTLLNTLVWGTCNTNTTEDQCVANMGWFASALKTACAQDLQDRNQMAVSTLTGLQAYSLVRDVGCLSDPTSNTYCYLNAVHSPQPFDLYFYNLPLGISLPKDTQPSCSPCIRSVMTGYSTALNNPDQAPLLTELKETYSSAANLAVQKCGAGYAAVVNGAVSTLTQGFSGWVTGVAVALCSTLLLGLP